MGQCPISPVTKREPGDEVMSDESDALQTDVGQVDNDYSIHRDELQDRSL
jgi:hypothetical protein